MSVRWKLNNAKRALKNSLLKRPTCVKKTRTQLQHANLQNQHLSAARCF